MFLQVVHSVEGGIVSNSDAAVIKPMLGHANVKQVGLDVEESQTSEGCRDNSDLGYALVQTRSKLELQVKTSYLYTKGRGYAWEQNKRMEIDGRSRNITEGYGI